MKDSRDDRHEGAMDTRFRVSFRPLLFAPMLLALLTCGTGCQTWMKPPAFANPMTWFKDKSAEEKHGVPQRLVVLWADDVMEQAGKPSTRGFGGRIYFYNAEDKPVPVEGQLTVYGYDDTIPKKGSQRNPDRKFVFTPEQFQSHFSESQIGPSYSVWIPWEDIDGPRRDISLVPVFITTSGKAIMGPQTINVLAARTPEGETKYNQLRMSQRTHHGPLAQASHLEAAASGNTGAATAGADPLSAPPSPAPERPTRVGLRTSTIPLHGALSERLRTAPPTPPIGFQSAPMNSPNAAPGTPGTTGAPGTPGTPGTTGAPGATATPGASSVTPAVIPPSAALPNGSPTNAGQPTNFGPAAEASPAFRPTTRPLMPPASLMR